MCKPRTNRDSFIEVYSARLARSKKSELPIKRFGHVSEVAPAVLLLASDDGGYFIGASMNMNGGDYMI